MLTKGEFSVTGAKKYFPVNALVGAKMEDSFPKLKSNSSANYFVEIHDDLLTNTKDHETDADLNDFNRKMLSVEKSSAQKIGLVYMGRQAPGGMNVVDGLLRYQAQRSNVELFGFINGVDGLMSNTHEVMTRENFANYMNLGGYDYIGRGPDELRSDEQKQKALEVATNLGFTGLVFVGATGCMTDALYLAEFFEANNSETRVVAISATVDGNIHHNYF